MNVRELIDILAPFGGVFAEKRGNEYLHGTSFVSGELRVQKAQFNLSTYYSVWYGGLGKADTQPVYVFAEKPGCSQILRFIRGDWEEEIKKEAEKRLPALNGSELVAKLV